MASLLRMINNISRCGSTFRAAHSSKNLPGIYHSYAFAVCKNPGWSQDRLAKHLCINKSSVARHLAFLEDNGYIERRTCERDKRETLVFPTQKMLDILPEITAITREWNARLTEGISEDELKVFTDVLAKLSDKAREIIKETGLQNENDR